MRITIQIEDGDSYTEVWRDDVEYLPSILDLYKEALSRMTFTQVCSVAAEYESGKMVWSDDI